MRRRYIVRLTSAAAFLIVTSAVAAELDIPPPVKPKAPVAVTSPRNTSVYVNQANCLRWTDECVNCTRGMDGQAPTCSNIGFACQPKDIRCIGVEDTQGKPGKE